MRIQVHTSTLLPLGLQAAVLIQLSMAATAANGTWTRSGSASWGNAGNWSGNTIAGGSQATAAFNVIDLIGNVTVTMDGSRTVGALSFSDITPSHDWNLRPGTGGTLTLDAGGAAPVITVANRTATIGTVLAGSAGFSKTGNGTLVLSAINSYSGPTTILAGTLRLDPPPAFPAGMQVMPLGDSITYGHNGGNAGYRGPLYQLLNPLAPDFRYIGTSVERPGSLPLLPIDQTHHEGHPSYTIQDTSNNLDGFDNARFLEFGGPERNPNGGFWLTGGNGTGRAAAFPNLITLMSGTNDLVNPTGLQNRLHGLIDKITTLRPDTCLCVARITPVTGNPGVAPYNQIIDSEIAGFQAQGRKVYPVDLNTNFPSNALFDDAHPNDTGFNWMAIQWYESIIRVFTPAGGLSKGIPLTSPVTVAGGAVLDLHGNQAALGTVGLTGNISLGSGGQLTTQGLQVSQAGTIAGSGTIHGPVVNQSSVIGAPGGSLTFTGGFTNNRTLNASGGASLQFTGNFINNGTLECGPGGGPAFPGSLTNNGVIRLTGGAGLQVGTSLVNNGILDLITGGAVLPADFTNNGLVIDQSAVKLESVSTHANVIELKVHSHSGHLYQVQVSDTLATGSWVNEGDPQPGISGSLLTFTAVRNANRGFYRIRVSP